MADVIYRLTYEATVDDAVDVSWRLANRTRDFRRQLQTNTAIGGAVGGLVFFGVWMFVVSSSLLNVVLAAVAATTFGIVFAAVFRRFLESQIRRQQRRTITEQFGGKRAVPSELELRPDAIWVRQAGIEMLLPWAVCTGVQNNRGDVQLNFTPGICVIRNKHFASAADRERFLETVRRLSARSAPPTTPAPTT